MIRQKKEEKIKKEGLETFVDKEDFSYSPETKEVGKKVEDLQPEEIRELKERIEKTDIDDSLKMQAIAHAQDIKALDEEKKIKKLISLAKVKGVIYAVHVAQKMNDPYILDLLHDILAKEGYYKKFTK